MFKFTDGNMVKFDNIIDNFTTMNSGYAARQELPENLKNQFHMAAMMLIMKVKLASSGFSRYKNLSQKFLLVYTLCSEQLFK